jgi:putative ABC transport system ATP-binding protein
MSQEAIMQKPAPALRLRSLLGGFSATRTKAAGRAITGGAEHPVAVELSGVSKIYGAGEVAVHALRDVDFSLPRGEITAIWGPSGSGKSTLLNLIGLADRPSSGKVLINGIDTGSLNESAAAALRNRCIGFVFQNFNLVPVLSALENVMLPLQIAGTAGARKRALAMLEEVGLEHKANARPDKLSGGQRQRVAVARALVTEPDLVIADEPTANLDSETSARIIALMRSLNASHRTTFLISTHDARVLDDVDRKIKLIDGRITQE